MGNKREVTAKMNSSLADAIKYLEDLTKSLKAGKVVVQQGEEFIALTPKENVFVEVEALEKKRKERLSIEISWLQDDVTENPSEFQISSTEPKITPAPESSASSTPA